MKLVDAPLRLRLGVGSAPPLGRSLIFPVRPPGRPWDEGGFRIQGDYRYGWGRRFFYTRELVAKRFKESLS